MLVKYVATFKRICVVTSLGVDASQLRMFFLILYVAQVPGFRITQNGITP